MGAVGAALIDEEHELAAGALPLRALCGHDAIENPLHQMAGGAFELRRADRRNSLPVVVTLQAQGAAFFMRRFRESPLFERNDLVHRYQPGLQSPWGFQKRDKEERNVSRNNRDIQRRCAQRSAPANRHTSRPRRQNAGRVDSTGTGQRHTGSVRQHEPKEPSDKGSAMLLRARYSASADDRGHSDYAHWL